MESSTEVRASWQEPLEFNGIFKRYVLMYGKARDKLIESIYMNNKRTSYLLESLEEYTEYFVQIYAETAVSGASSNIEQARTLEDGKLLFFFLMIVI